MSAFVMALSTADARPATLIDPTRRRSRRVAPRGRVCRRQPSGVSPRVKRDDFCCIADVARRTTVAPVAQTQCSCSEALHVPAMPIDRVWCVSTLRLSRNCLCRRTHRTVAATGRCRRCVPFHCSAIKPYIAHHLWPLLCCVLCTMFDRAIKSRLKPFKRL